MSDQCTRACEGCAFTEGSTTHDDEPHNNIRAQLCLLGGIVFYCHHAKDGSLQNLRDIKMTERREMVRAGNLVVCRGWQREVAELAATGYYKMAPLAKQAYAMLGLGALQIFTGTDDEEKKRRAGRTLKDVILALNKERGFTEVVEND